MALPNVIPIAYEPHHRTSTIGSFEGGQFFASIHGAHQPGEPSDPATVRWYVVLHVFDHAGHDLRSDIWCAGVGGLPEAAEARLQRLLDGLPGRKYCDIAIRPFRVEQDGILFGLVDESDAERGDWAEFYPDRLGFAEPWDGLYDT